MKEDYSKFVEDAPKTDDLKELSELATELYLAELELAQKQEEAKAAQKKVQDIAEYQIPDKMMEIGILEFTTTSGIKLKIKDVVRTSIPLALREEAYKWLQDRGHGDLIKHNIVVGFGRDEEDAAKEFLTELDAKGMRTKDERKVESATLRKFVTDMLAEGSEVPKDLFGVYQFRQAKITGKPESQFGE